MKKIYLLFILLTLNSCSLTKAETKKELHAWNGTYWGMQENDLKNHLKSNLKLNNYSESYCDEKQLKYNNLNKYNCKFVSVNRYNIGNNNYSISFYLKNKKLEKVNFSHLESYEIMAEREKLNEDILLNMSRVKQSGMTATLELKKFLTDKYGSPNESLELNNKFEYHWNVGYTNIKLSTIAGIGAYLNYKPNHNQIYLDDLPDEKNKI